MDAFLRPAHKWSQNANRNCFPKNIPGVEDDVGYLP